MFEDEIHLIHGYMIITSINKHTITQIRWYYENIQGHTLQ